MEIAYTRMNKGNLIFSNLLSPNLLHHFESWSTPSCQKCGFFANPSFTFGPLPIRAILENWSWCEKRIPHKFHVFLSSLWFFSKFILESVIVLDRDQNDSKWSKIIERILNEKTIINSRVIWNLTDWKSLSKPNPMTYLKNFGPNHLIRYPYKTPFKERLFSDKVPL